MAIMGCVLGREPQFFIDPNLCTTLNQNSLIPAKAGIQFVFLIHLETYSHLK